MATRKPKATRIKVQLANVSLHRQGLSVEYQGVPPDQIEAVASHLLTALRNLTQRFPELVTDGGSLHAHPLGEVPEDEEPEARRVGFLR